METYRGKHIWALAFGSKQRLLVTMGALSAVVVALLSASSFNTRSSDNVEESKVPRKNWKVEYEAYSCMSGPWNDCSTRE